MVLFAVELSDTQMGAWIAAVGAAFTVVGGAIVALYLKYRRGTSDIEIKERDEVGKQSRTHDDFLFAQYRKYVEEQQVRVDKMEALFDAQKGERAELIKINSALTEREAWYKSRIAAVEKAEAECTFRVAGLERRIDELETEMRNKSS